MRTTTSAPLIAAYQIVYDDLTSLNVDPHFQPLDNSLGAEGWYEFWPILQFLSDRELRDDTWYAFVSPKFFEKSLVTWEQIVTVLASSEKADVALFSYNWPSLVISRNPWIYGEKFHPGLIECMENFLRSIGRYEDISELVTDFDTSVNSNYIFAKSSFWSDWKVMAEQYLDYCTRGGAELADNQTTWHNGHHQAPMRAFVQERLCCYLLLKNKYNVVHPDYTSDLPLKVFRSANSESKYVRKCLWAAERSKALSRRTGIKELLMFHRVFIHLAYKAAHVEAGNIGQDLE